MSALPRLTWTATSLLVALACTIMLGLSLNSSLGASVATIVNPGNAFGIQQETFLKQLSPAPTATPTATCTAGWSSAPTSTCASIDLYGDQTDLVPGEAGQYTEAWFSKVGPGEAIGITAIVNACNTVGPTSGCTTDFSGAGMKVSFDYNVGSGWAGLYGNQAGDLVGENLIYNNPDPNNNYNPHRDIINRLNANESFGIRAQPLAGSDGEYGAIVINEITWTLQVQ